MEQDQSTSSSSANFDESAPKKHKPWKRSREQWRTWSVTAEEKWKMPCNLTSFGVTEMKQETKQNYARNQKKKDKPISSTMHWCMHNTTKSAKALTESKTLPKQVQQMDHNSQPNENTFPLHNKNVYTWRHNFRNLRSDQISFNWNDRAHPMFQ